MNIKLESFKKSTDHDPGMERKLVRTHSAQRMPFAQEEEADE